MLIASATSACEVIGACDVTCDATDPDGNPIKRSFGPYEDYTEEECEAEVTRIEDDYDTIESGACSYSWDG